MALPSNPQHGSVGTLNGSDYVYDSDKSQWLITFTDKDKILQDNIDSDILFVKGLITAGAQSAGFPVGSVVPFAKSGLPQGFMLADGSEFNSSLYPQLFDYLGSSTLPDYSNRAFGYKVYDLNDSENYDEVVLAIAAYNGAGITTDSDIIAAQVEQQVSELTARITELEDDLTQAISDRVFTDNQLSARIDNNDSDIALNGRFYVQSTAPSGGPNSGWVNTNTMKLNIWDVTSDTWIEVITT